MIEVKENALWPRFLREDKNGGAMCAAIKTGMEYFAQAIDNGVKLIRDVDSMPQWRLDEMARELNCLYDYSADIDKKRAWIKNALPMAMRLGTVSAIHDYLNGYFDSIDVLETGNFHFVISLAGTLGTDAQRWMYKAVAAAKNVRSVFDGVSVNIDTPALILGAAESENAVQLYAMRCDTGACGQEVIV